MLCLKCRNMPPKAKKQGYAPDGSKNLRTEFTEDDLVNVLGFSDKMVGPKKKQKVKD